MARCEFPKITCTCAKDVCNFLECSGYYNIQWRATRDRVFNQHISNADRIRAMTDEELADVISAWILASPKFINRDNAHDGLLNWLKQECES